MTHSPPPLLQRAAVLACLVLAACASPKEPVGPDRCHPRPNGAQCITQAPRPLSLLPVGTPVTVRVDARCEWNPTGVIVERGSRYRLAVTNVVEDWIRGPRILSVSGKYVQRWARASEFPMYTLVAAQGRDERTYFAAGPETTFTAASGDELLFFANDWPGYYDSNRGCVEVEIRKLPP
ncbi:hypothetical protein [Ramlibacter alkalitolerans]|uniref:Lipoprotein n=1 Tax=Ramlibacter alkalitolerans TaxID=2039631 RepID=A0ABS1JTE3_9BURK|nr:hypothetical protein [Ramlibacter alkalitolerans]MBL0427549.1 hypothetical protein [Ramlibacter alkalitolerans]